jgi:hypothetical protein
LNKINVLLSRRGKDLFEVKVTQPDGVVQRGTQQIRQGENVSIDIGIDIDVGDGWIVLDGEKYFKKRLDS